MEELNSQISIEDNSDYFDDIEDDNSNAPLMINEGIARKRKVPSFDIINSIYDIEQKKVKKRNNLFEIHLYIKLFLKNNILILLKNYFNS